MPMKKEAINLINNRFFQLLKQETEAEHFERWQGALTVAEREDIYLEVKVFNSLIERIEHDCADLGVTFFRSDFGLRLFLSQRRFIRSRGSKKIARLGNLFGYAGPGFVIGLMPASMR